MEMDITLINYPNKTKVDTVPRDEFQEWSLGYAEKTNPRRVYTLLWTLYSILPA